MYEKFEDLFNKVGLQMFVLATQHLLSLGFSAISKLTDNDIDYIAKFTDNNINSISSIPLMTEQFCKDINLIAREITSICGDDVIGLIQYYNSKDILEKLC